MATGTPSSSANRQLPPPLYGISNIPPSSALLAPPESPWDLGPANRDDFVTPTGPAMPVPETQKPNQFEKDKLWADLNRVYAENEETIERSIALDAAEVAKEGGVGRLTRSLDNFAETAKVISEALIALGNVHPAIGVAVFAFHSIISLDVSRRENDRKVLAVKLQMQSMMCAMFQLRRLRFEHFGDDQDSGRDNLRRLMRNIADEITQCGSDITYYREKKTIAKFINSKVYERRFAEHIETFTLRRSELQLVIAGYTAAGVSASHQQLVTANEKMKIIDSKLDIVVEKIFRKLDTPQEANVLKFIAEHGGPAECVAKDSLLGKLLAMAGQPGSSEKGSTGGVGTNKGGNQDADVRDGSRESTAEQLRRYRKTLTEELAINLDKAFKDNLSRFEALLKVQNNNLQRISDQLHGQGVMVLDSKHRLEELMNTSLMILEEGKVIKRAVLPTRLGKIQLKDPVLQTIWERMGLKANVKAKHFVLGLRDHLLYDLSSNPASAVVTPALPPLDGLPSATPEIRPIGNLGDARVVNPQQNQARIHINPDERWVLQYLDILHVQPILEAMDEDGSGFISVKEANRFAIARPPDCSFLRWLAYWAAGWHLTITTYRSRIYELLQQMRQKLVPSPTFQWYYSHDMHLFANNNFIEGYLNSDAMWRIDLLLKSTRPVQDRYISDEHLTELAMNITLGKEGRLRDNLRDLGFVIRSAQDARVVIGPDRIEASIYPLLWLLLRRHMDIIELASSHLLDSRELELHAQSLENVFILFDERIATLKATFSQVHPNIQRQFEHFAYGIFVSTYLEKDVNEPDYGKLSILNFNDSNNVLGMYSYQADDTVSGVDILVHPPVRRPKTGLWSQKIALRAQEAKDIALVHETRERDEKILDELKRKAEEKKRLEEEEAANNPPVDDTPAEEEATPTADDVEGAAEGAAEGDSNPEETSAGDAKEKESDGNGDKDPEENGDTDEDEKEKENGSAEPSTGDAVGSTSTDSEDEESTPPVVNGNDASEATSTGDSDSVAEADITIRPGTPPGEEPAESKEDEPAVKVDAADQDNADPAPGTPSSSKHEEGTDSDSDEEEPDEPAEEVLSYEVPSYVKDFCGYWTIENIMTAEPGRKSVYRFWHCVLRPGPELGTVVGEGETFFARITIKGKLVEVSEEEAEKITKIDQRELPAPVEEEKEDGEETEKEDEEKEGVEGGAEDETEGEAKKEKEEDVEVKNDAKVDSADKTSSEAEKVDDEDKESEDGEASDEEEEQDEETKGGDDTKDRINEEPTPPEPKREEEDAETKDPLTNADAGPSEAKPTPIYCFKLDMIPNTVAYLGVRGKGIYNHERDIIEGIWYFFDWEEEAKAREQAEAEAQGSDVDEANEDHSDHEGDKEGSESGGTDDKAPQEEGGVDDDVTPKPEDEDKKLEVEDTGKQDDKPLETDTGSSSEEEEPLKVTPDPAPAEGDDKQTDATSDDSGSEEGTEPDTQDETVPAEAREPPPDSTDPVPDVVDADPPTDGDHVDETSPEDDHAEETPAEGDNAHENHSEATVEEEHAVEGIFTFRRTPSIFFRFRKYLDDPRSADAKPLPVVEDEETTETPAADVSDEAEAKPDAVSTQPNISDSKLSPEMIPLPPDTPAGASPELPTPPTPLWRRRWQFACQSILYYVRQRMFSWQLFLERLEERRHWIEYTLQEKWQDKYPGENRTQLTDEMWAKLNEVRFITPIENGRLYEATVTWFVERQTKITGFGISCDGCYCKVMVVTRFQCITCIREDYSNQIDLCMDCLDKTILSLTDNAFDHYPTHSLIRHRRLTFTMEIASVISSAKEKSTRLKEHFRKLEAQAESASKATVSGGSGGTGGGDKNKAKVEAEVVDPLTCACCGKEVKLPCYLCLECDFDTLICLDCDAKHNAIATDPYHSSRYSHTRVHRLLLIKTSEAVTGRRPTPQTEVAKLDKRLEDVENRIQEQFEKRMTGIEGRISSIEKQMQALEGTMNTKMDLVIGLLQKVVMAGTEDKKNISN